MVLNVLLNNTDDHLKNHAFIYNIEKKEYRLSPLYDLNMQFNKQSKHMIHIGKDMRKSTLSNCLSSAKYFGIKETIAIKIIENIKNEVKNISSYIESLNINLDEETLKKLNEITTLKTNEKIKLNQNIKYK